MGGWSTTRYQCRDQRVATLDAETSEFHAAARALAAPAGGSASVRALDDEQGPGLHKLRTLMDTRIGSFVMTAPISNGLPELASDAPVTSPGDNALPDDQDRGDRCEGQ